jgi:hypothetical protein
MGHSVCHVRDHGCSSGDRNATRPHEAHPRLHAARAADGEDHEAVSGVARPSAYGVDAQRGCEPAGLRADACGPLERLDHRAVHPRAPRLRSPVPPTAPKTASSPPSAAIRYQVAVPSPPSPTLLRPPKRPRCRTFLYSPGWTRTNNPPVNSRMLCQLSYRGSAAEFGFGMVPEGSRPEPCGGWRRPAPGRPSRRSRGRRRCGARLQ